MKIGSAVNDHRSLRARVRCAQLYPRDQRRRDRDRTRAPSSGIGELGGNVTSARPLLGYLPQRGVRRVKKGGRAASPSTAEITVSRHLRPTKGPSHIVQPSSLAAVSDVPGAGYASSVRTARRDCRRRNTSRMTDHAERLPSRKRARGRGLITHVHPAGDGAK